MAIHSQSASHESSPAFSKHRQAGFTFSEVLVSIGVMAVCMLGMLTIEKFIVAKYQGSYLRTQAVFHISELVERMYANPVGVQMGDYLKPVSTTGKNCTSKNCTPSELAAFDLREWIAGVEAVLPEPDVTISRQMQEYTIRVEWSESPVKPQAVAERKQVSFTYTSPAVY